MVSVSHFTLSKYCRGGRLCICCRAGAAELLFTLFLIVLLLSDPSSSCCLAFQTSLYVYHSNNILSPRRSCLNKQMMSSNSNVPTDDDATKTSIPSSTSVYATVQQSFTRPIAQEMVTSILCPQNEERDRDKAGMEAYSNGDKMVTNADPRTEYTYGEFPLDSFDLLVDRALDYVDLEQQQQQVDRDGNPTMIDLGSGCGRIVLYAALARGGRGIDSTTSRDAGEMKWNVHGIEIGKQLHSLAINSLQRGTEEGWFQSTEDESGSVGFHNGNALLTDDPYYDVDTQSSKSIQSLLSQTNLLFAYSTVWETNPVQSFNPELQAMILSPKWSLTLAEICTNGCVAITTDRALNPEDGWRLLHRMEVDNPSVWGSVGYISILEK